MSKNFFALTVSALLLQGLVGCSQIEEEEILGHGPRISDGEKMRICRNRGFTDAVCHQLVEKLCFGLHHADSFTECVNRNTRSSGRVELNPVVGVDMEALLHTKGGGN